MQLPPFRLPESGDVVGEYRLTAKLGDGGQGLIFKAEYAGRFFVLKFFRARELDAWGLTEVSLLQKFKHPHIVGVRGYGRWPDPDAGYFYIVMEWVDGQTLEHYALTANPGARVCARLVLTLARTLEAVHRKKVLHRDVKRDNILIRARDGAPVLVDFGIGALAEATPAPGSSVLPPGTQEYVSPEAWRFLGEHVGEPVTYTSQVSDELWALGVTFYWLLTQRLPFGTRRNPLLVRKILSHSPPAPHECSPRVPQALSDVCMRLLEKSPAARFADMAALATALESVLEAAHEDASWDVPLGDPDAPEEATPDELPAGGPWEEVERKVRRCFAPPRRGRQKPSPEEGRTPVVASPPLPEAGLSPVPVAEALAARMAALFPGHAWEGVPWAQAPAVAKLLAPAPPAATPREREGWRRAVSRAWPTDVGGVPVRALALDSLRRAARGLALLGLAAGVGAAVLLATPSMMSAREEARGAPAPAVSPLAQEMAGERDTPQAGGGAVWFAPPTPAPEFSPAMPHQEDVRVKSPDQPRPPVRRARLGAQCTTLACCAMLGGCAGAPPVTRSASAPPRPEACPPGAKEAMAQLRLEVGEKVRGDFPVIGGTKDVIINRFTTFQLGQTFGELEPGTVLSGRLIFAQGRVYGRFTQAKQTQSGGGQTYPVCLELQDRQGELGVKIEREEGPDSAVVSSAAKAMVVKRFE